MTQQTRAQIKTNVNAVYVNNSLGATKNSDFNATLNNIADSMLVLTAGEPMQTVAGPVNFTGGLSQDGELIVGLCDTATIQSAQDWIDNSTELEPGIRQLDLNKTYRICGSVSRSFTLAHNGFTTLMGDNPNLDIDTYTGTGDAWLSVDPNDGFTMRRCTTRGVAGTGSRFINQSTGAFNLTVIEGFIEYDNMGTSDAKITFLNLANFGSAAIPVRVGFVPTSTAAFALIVDACQMTISDAHTTIGFDLLNFTSLGSISFVLSFAGGATSTGIRGKTSSTNLTGNARGTIRNGNMTTLQTPLVNISKNDDKWVIASVRGVESTMPDAYASSVAGGTTTITTPGVPVKLVGTFVDIGSSQFTINASGRATYIGLDPIRVPVDAGVSVQPSAGTNKVLFIEIAKNGTPLELSGERYTKSGARADNADPLYLSTFAQPTLVTNDYIEIFVGNTTDTTSVITSNVKLRIN